jgi:deoxyribodipyrimidine photo-lyase
MWFRRDLRSREHAALAAAADADRRRALRARRCVASAVGRPRLAFLYQSLRDLDAQLRHHGGERVVRRGTPENVVPAVARDAGATSVHISADFGPYGAARDKRVDAALGEVPLIRTGSAYAVAPGRIVKSDGQPFRVFTPFYRTWPAHGWPAPAESDPARISWRRGISGAGVPQDPKLPARLVLP